ncbi:MAG: magnesium transporter [Planctomycetes bacterium]|nr:magnesium transporter [Planctomycetota bacterium]
MDRAEGQLTPETNEVLTDLKAAWPVMAPDERIESLKLLPEDEAEEFFLALTSREQAQLLVALPHLTRRAWLRLLPLDDAADVVQHASRGDRDALLALLDDVSLREVRALLAYAEDEAGGLMNPRFARLRPEMTVDEAILYLRRQAQQKDRPIYYCYVLDSEQKLKGVLSFRQLLTAPAAKRIEEVMITDVVTVAEDLDQEKIAPLFSAKNLVALPVLDGDGRMKGVVSAEDIVDVVQEEATEDIQKLAGVEALDAPYLQVSILEMVRKRAGWLAILFLGGTLTASAIGHFDHELSLWKVLMAYIPLIMSSGGNSGSQSATLVIRALALGELRLDDWWRVFKRELIGGLTLGLFLSCIGMLRVLLWQWLFGEYGDHFMRLAFTISFSVVGVVLFGSLVGSLLPFLLRLLKLDPATACSPFVATFCDVTGLMIYFGFCSLIYIPHVPSDLPP